MSPLQIILLVIVGLGGVITIAGSAMMVIAAFKQSILWGVLIVMFPPITTICFLILHWQDAKKAFSFQVMGSSFVMLGFAVASRLLDPEDMEALTKNRMATDEEIEFTEENSPLIGILQETASDISPVTTPDDATGQSKAGEYIGMTVEQVKAQRGEPKAVMQFEGKTLFMYNDYELVSEDGTNITGESHR